MAQSHTSRLTNPVKETIQAGGVSLGRDAERQVRSRPPGSAIRDYSDR
jgi:hypothetical protein